jgi:hypothetical protein
MSTHYSAAQLMHLAEEGLLEKQELADLLTPELRCEFLNGCEAVERDFTRACATDGNFCLPGGCALEGEACLNALLKVGPEYNKACGWLWLPLFRSSKHAA